jgi:iron(III) transport system permease protein
LDGASGLTRFLRIAAAQRIGALTAAWLVVLAVATGDLAASILVVPPGVDTVAIRIFGLVHYGVDDQLAGLSLTTAGGFVVIAAIAMSLFSRSRTLGRAD